jgi:putative transposase
MKFKKNCFLCGVVYLIGMQKIQAFKFELMPTGVQRRTMHQFAGAARWVYNKGLEMQQARYAKGEKFASYVDACKWLLLWKAQHPWLKSAHAQMQVCRLER